MTPRALNRALLARQHLLTRTTASTADVLTHLVGMQSQEPQAPYTGLWSRIEGFDPATLSDAMEDRSVVRIVLQRSTIHVVTSDDAYLLRAVLQTMLERRYATSIHAKALPGADVASIAEQGRALCAERPRSFAELGNALAADHDGPPENLAQVVRTYVPLVQVPPRGLWGRGGLARHVPLDDWSPPPRRGALTVDDLVLRYLAAFGPATAQDAQTWSGLTKLGEVLDRLGRKVKDVGEGYYDLPDAPRPGEDAEAPVRFLPSYDNLLLGHADRSRVMDDAARQAFWSPNGAVPRGVLVDGTVAATWRRAKGGPVEVTPIRRLTKAEQTAVDDEAHAVEAFLTTGD